MEEFPNDDRKKRIVPTRKALELQQCIEEQIQKHSAELCQGIPPGDLAVTEHALNVMLCNLKRTNTGRKSK